MLATGLALLGARARPEAPAPARVTANDNTRPAGTLRGGVLTVQLELREAEWHPDGDDAPGVPMLAFAEVGGAALIPGPLIRVRAGTVVEVRVGNPRRDTLRVYGLHDRVGAAPVKDAPLIVAPGGSATVRFRLDSAGTYLYWGSTSGRPLAFRTREDSQLSGAIVVDPAHGPPARDRIFVIGGWTDTVARAMVPRKQVLFVFNGRSWPHSERLSYAVGDTVQWRILNASADLHPIHLHGFYYRVESRGDGRGDTTYAPGAQDLEVTEGMLTASTMRLRWVPERAGNWLVHCHIPEHFGPRGALGALPSSERLATDHANHATGGMNGLVMGVTVRPSRVAEPRIATTASTRRLRLLVREAVGTTPTRPLYRYAWHERGAEPAPDSGMGGGPTMDLVRGQPVRIMVVNRLREPTAVHWHGIELDPYYDGVPGYSGAGTRVTPLIAPGDSFEVRFTPPRAGTFIYHTHAHEERQQRAGLAGALVVNEPGVRRAPDTDVPILITSPADTGAGTDYVLVNGETTPTPLRWQVGTTYRLRFVEITTIRAVAFAALWRGAAPDTVPMPWTPVSKDGAAIPIARQRAVPAKVVMGIGETADFEVTPDTAGRLWLELYVGRPPFPRVRLNMIPIDVVRAERDR